jgi:release factor glutamine methyltransferase
LDLGTGSGCLILTLLSELNDAIGTATDISPKSLDVAKQNALLLNLTDRISFLESNWLDSVTGQFDIIVSNPPYIETRTVKTLSDDVKKYDPIMALDGGTDGLVPYKILFPQIRHNLKKGGFIAMEHGAGQSRDIIRLIDNAQFQEIRSTLDLSGHDRVVSAVAQ